MSLENTHPFLLGKGRMVRYGRAKRCTESRPRNERDRERANRDRGYFRRSGCTCFWKRQIPSTSSKFCLINNGHLFLFLVRARVFSKRVPFLRERASVLRALDETNHPNEETCSVLLPDPSKRSRIVDCLLEVSVSPRPGAGEQHETSDV